MHEDEEKSHAIVDWVGRGPSGRGGLQHHPSDRSRNSGEPQRRLSRRRQRSFP